MTIKKTAFLALSLVLSTSAFAQLSGDGFYRVKNVSTARYINIIDNTGKVDYASTYVDLSALQTVRHFDNVVNNPGTIIYIREEGYYQYSLAAQGTDSKQISGEYLQVTPVGDAYQAWASKKGMTVYLSDIEDLEDPDIATVTQSDANSSKTTKNWYIIPVKADIDEQYFGIKPEQQVNDTYWATMYAYFPFKTYSEGMTVYYTDKIANGKVIVKEVTGTVPGQSAVIIKCSSATADGNRIDIVDENVNAISNSLLGGVYFCNHNAGHINRREYNPNSMRVLGTTKEGKIGFVKAPESYLSQGCIPANKAYLKVPTGTADELEIMTEEEYAEWITGIDNVILDSTKSNGIYTLTGVQVRQKGDSTEGLPRGIYVVNGKKVIVQ
ncbi:MAG: hypothetical protein K6F22_06130 [Prevotella sp.]|nr:hypothetical protein [Prevotella sp.]